VKPIEDLPNRFLVLNDKGGESILKLEGLAHVFLNNVLSGKTGLSNIANWTVWFCQQNFYLSFLFLVSVDLRTKCILWTLVLSLVITIWTNILINYEFMFIMPKYVVDECLRWMMLVLLSIWSVWKKSDSPVFQIGCSGFSSCAEKTGCSGLPNWIVQHW
jgi:hypothetical protein